MRRSSMAVLVLAFAFLILAASLYWQASNTAIPRITSKEASSIIARGRLALEQKDVGEIMSMMAPDARIVGRSLGEVEEYMDTAMRQVHGNLTITARNVEAHQNGNRAEFAFEMDVIQKSSRIDAIYYPNLHVTVNLEKRKANRWLGLIPVEEWKITRVDTSPVIATPPP